MKKLRRFLDLYSNCISIPIKVYIYIDAKKRRVIIPKDYLTILVNELKRFANWNGKIRYSWFWSAGVHVPNASATIPGLILVNAEWASKIVLNQNNPHMHDAFALTICHEITHQEKDFYYFDFFSADGKFVNWVDEVHADFGGVQKGLDSNRSRASFAMKYKLSCKKKKDKDTRSHPSWNKRIEYVLNYDFNEELIDKSYSKNLGMSQGMTLKELVSTTTDFDEYDSYYPYVGVKDKNDKEIYAGDILQLHITKDLMDIHKDGFSASNCGQAIAKNKDITDVVICIRPENRTLDIYYTVYFLENEKIPRDKEDGELDYVCTGTGLDFIQYLTQKGSIYIGNIVESPNLLEDLGVEIEDPEIEL